LILAPHTHPSRPFITGEVSMPFFTWRTVLLTLLMSFTLGGCSGNYKFNDSDYRPLGDPQAINRGK
jgi:hypothetical protein